MKILNCKIGRIAIRLWFCEWILYLELQEYKEFVGEEGADPNILRDYQKALEKLKAREKLGNRQIETFFYLNSSISNVW